MGTFFLSREKKVRRAERPHGPARGLAASSLLAFFSRWDLGSPRTPHVSFIRSQDGVLSTSYWYGHWLARREDCVLQEVQGENHHHDIQKGVQDGAQSFGRVQKIKFIAQECVCRRIWRTQLLQSSGYTRWGQGGSRPTSCRGQSRSSGRRWEKEASTGQRVGYCP